MRLEPYRTQMMVIALILAALLWVCGSCAYRSLTDLSPGPTPAEQQRQEDTP